MYSKNSVFPLHNRLIIEIKLLWHSFLAWSPPKLIGVPQSQTRNKTLYKKVECGIANLYLRLACAFRDTSQLPRKIKMKSPSATYTDVAQNDVYVLWKGWIDLTVRSFIGVVTCLIKNIIVACSYLPSNPSLPLFYHIMVLKHPKENWFIEPPKKNDL